MINNDDELGAIVKISIIIVMIMKFKLKIKLNINFIFTRHFIITIRITIDYFH